MERGHQRATAAPTREGKLLLRCECGWESPAGGTAQQVGEDWDRHVEEIVDLRVEE